MATKVTQDMIVQMNELYVKLKTYAAVAREIGCAPTTVKRYIIPGYTPLSEIKIIKFDKSKFHDVDFTPFKNYENWGPLCVLTPEEEEQMKELQKEVQI